MKFLQKLKKIKQIETSKKNLYKYILLENNEISQLDYDSLSVLSKDSCLYFFPSFNIDYELNISGFRVEDFDGFLSLKLNLACGFSVEKNKEEFRDFLLKLELENPREGWASNDVFDRIFKDYESKIKAALYEYIEPVKAHMLKKFQGEAILSEGDFEQIAKNLPSFLLAKYKSCEVIFLEKKHSEKAPVEIPKKKNFFKRFCIFSIFSLAFFAGAAALSYIYLKPIYPEFFAKIDALLGENEALEAMELRIEKEAEKVSEVELKEELEAELKKAPEPEVVHNYFVKIYMPMNANLENIALSLKKNGKMLHINTIEVEGAFGSKTAEVEISSTENLNYLEKNLYLILSPKLKNLSRKDIKIRQLN